MPGVEDPTAASLIAAAEKHHAQLRAELTERTEAFVAAVAMDQPYEWRQAELVDFLQETLRPHTEAEWNLIFSRAPTGQTALLLQAMEDEHHRVTALMDEVEQAVTVTDAVIAAGALVVLVDVRIQQENQHLLPALAASGVDLAQLLSEHPEIVGEAGSVGLT